MAKDSHGIYNYESHNVAKTIYTPSDNSYLYKAIDEAGNGLYITESSC